MYSVTGKTGVPSSSRLLSGLEMSDQNVWEPRGKNWRTALIAGEI